MGTFGPSIPEGGEFLGFVRLARSEFGTINFHVVELSCEGAGPPNEFHITDADCAIVFVLPELSVALDRGIAKSGHETTPSHGQDGVAIKSGPSDVDSYGHDVD